MAKDAEKEEATVAVDGQPQALSKSARKKQQKQERLAAWWKATEKERRRTDVERRRREWEETLAAPPLEEARIEMVEARRKVRRERVGQRAEERGARAERPRRATEGAGQKVVLDLEFGDLMRPNEIHSLPALPCPATPDLVATYAPNVALPRRSPAATDAPMRPIPALLWPHQTPRRHTTLHAAGSLPLRPLGPPLPPGSFHHATEHEAGGRLPVPQDQQRRRGWFLHRDLCRRRRHRHRANGELGCERSFHGGDGHDDQADGIGHVRSPELRGCRGHGK